MTLFVPARKLLTNAPSRSHTFLPCRYNRRAITPNRFFILFYSVNSDLQSYLQLHWGSKISQRLNHEG